MEFINNVLINYFHSINLMIFFHNLLINQNIIIIFKLNNKMKKNKINKLFNNKSINHKK